MVISHSLKFVPGSNEDSHQHKLGTNHAVRHRAGANLLPNAQYYHL